MKSFMIKGRTNGQPIVGAGHVFREPPLILPHGGLGTFYNKEAIRKMVSPMICPDQAEEQGTSCANLQENRIGELDINQETRYLIYFTSSQLSNNFVCTRIG